MKNIYLFLILFFAFFGQMTAQNQEIYKKVKIHLNGKSPEKLAACGIDLEHGFWENKQFFTGEFSESELRLMTEKGFYFDVLIEDVVANFLKNNRIPDLSTAQKRTENACNYPEIVIPENFKLGTMGGYFTYEEAEQHFKSMKSKFPNLISDINNIGDFRTHENRPLNWLKITKNPEKNEVKPEILYTALHHAREPASLSQLIFFMWYVLENYGKNQFITDLVDNTELYFVPFVNPDGYTYNQSVAPGGGGMWRKNRKNTGNGNYGVDLNRNYGFGFGEDETGSSSDPKSEVYRGTKAFSEPETQAIKYFCEQRKFELALNYHSSGNYLIKPPGSKYQISESEETTLNLIGHELTANNHFLFGDALFTVGYTVNGVSDDWMYSKTASKNRIHSFTPEVGTTFWADASEIIPICQSTLMQNLSLASLVFPKYNLEDLSEDFFSEENLSFEFMLKNVGLTQKSSKINIKSLSPNFTVKTGESLTLDLKNAEEKKFIFSADFVKKPKNGDTVIFEISVENGVNSFKKQFTKYVGKTVTFLQDDCENAEKWNGTWGNSRSVFYAGRASLTDSPLTFYSSQKTNIFVLKTPVDLTRAQQAQLSFYAKWETELNFDGVFLEISADNSPWTALCMPSARLNAAGKPFYDGFQDVWRKEKIDLSEFAGKKISLRFKLQSDEGMQKDGFYFDNLLIKGIEKEGEVTLGENDDFNENNLLIYPNPSNGQFKISFHFSNFSTETTLEITDLTGKIIVKKSVENNLQELDIQLTAGFYLCKLSRNGKTICKKILVN